jgi:hypothetical protein
VFPVDAQIDEEVICAVENMTRDAVAGAHARGQRLPQAVENQPRQQTMCQRLDSAWRDREDVHCAGD